MPSVVMAIVFAGAPIVNAFVSLLQHPPLGGWSAIKTQFWGGIGLAALGGCLVTLFKPAVGHAAAARGDGLHLAGLFAADRPGVGRVRRAACTPAR